MEKYICIIYTCICVQKNTYIRKHDRKIWVKSSWPHHNEAQRDNSFETGSLPTWLKKEKMCWFWPLEGNKQKKRQGTAFLGHSGREAADGNSPKIGEVPWNSWTLWSHSGDQGTSSDSTSCNCRKHRLLRARCLATSNKENPSWKLVRPAHDWGCYWRNKYLTRTDFEFGLGG